ncbi:hypothetical protein BDV93DRAFT_524841 [Ceratobasidium sp. AG-I]|nr:hypothetical protein BDV93DRAFT_524841 [Ceratobasidium sp. AG-I]
MQAGFRPSLPPAPASLPMRPASPLAFPVQVPRAVHPLYPIAPFNIMNRYSPSYPDISERTRLRPSSPHPRTRSASVSTVSSSTTVR